MKDAPLDMRFNKDQKRTAAEIINTWSEKDLIKVLWEFGEEPKSRQIAACIIDQEANINHPPIGSADIGGI